VAWRGILALKQTKVFDFYSVSHSLHGGRPAGAWGVRSRVETTTLAVRKRSPWTRRLGDGGRLPQQPLGCAGATNVQWTASGSSKGEIVPTRSLSGRAPAHMTVVTTAVTQVRICGDGRWAKGTSVQRPGSPAILNGVLQTPNSYFYHHHHSSSPEWSATSKSRWQTHSDAGCSAQPRLPNWVSGKMSLETVHSLVK